MKRVLSIILFLGAVFSSFSAPVRAEEAVGRVVSVTGQVMARIERDEKEKYGKVEPRYLHAGDKVYQKDVINTSSNSTVKVMFNDQSIMDIGQSSLFKVEQFEKGDKVEDRKVEFSMGYGKVRAAINQKVSPVGKFKLKTKAATMGVRGTEFYVDAGSSSQMKVGKEAAKMAPPPEMKVLVTEGKVEVAKNISSADMAAAGSKGKFVAPKPVMVNPGEKIAVVSASPSDIAAAAGGSAAKGGVSMAQANEMKIEKVSVQEMKAVTSELKVKDTTFAQAVVIESDNKPAGGNSQGSDNRGGGPRGPASEGGGAAAAAFSGGGAATLAIIKDVVAQKIEINVPKPGDLAIPGAMGTQPAFQTNFVPYVPKTVAHVTVRFIK